MVTGNRCIFVHAQVLLCVSVRGGMWCTCVPATLQRPANPSVWLWLYVCARGFTSTICGRFTCCWYSVCRHVIVLMCGMGFPPVTRAADPWALVGAGIWRAEW